MNNLYALFVYFVKPNRPAFVVLKRPLVHDYDHSNFYCYPITYEYCYSTAIIILLMSSQLFIRGTTYHDTFC